MGLREEMLRASTLTSWGSLLRPEPELEERRQRRMSSASTELPPPSRPPPRPELLMGGGGKPRTALGAPRRPLGKSVVVRSVEMRLPTLVGRLDARRRALGPPLLPEDFSTCCQSPPDLLQFLRP